MTAMLSRVIPAIRPRFNSRLFATNLVSPTTRVAVVTGAAQGIGETVALRLAEEGIDVAALDISAKEEQLLGVVDKIKAKGRRALPIFADVTDEEQVRGAVEKCIEELDSLDIVSWILP